MKKIFALFLACALVFLTACNHVPPLASGSTDGTNDPQKPSASVLKDTIIGWDGGNFLNLPSRIVFEKDVSDGHRNNVYYSKADGKIYLYCYDPLCTHKSGSCLAEPPSAITPFSFSEVHFINDRFYVLSVMNAQIYSFNFDGTDMKLEYDAGYSNEVPGPIWALTSFSYEDYIYINQYAGYDGKQHTLRFHVETGEMEDLTQKTGNYIFPRFIYNGEIYGYGESRIEDGKIVGGGYFKADLNLERLEEVEEIEAGLYFYGNRFFNRAWGENDKIIGIQILDMKTGEMTVISNADLGMDEDSKPEIACVDENYVYYFNSKKIVAGYKPHPKTGELSVPVTVNDAKLYGMNHAVTNPVCIFDDSKFSLDGYCATAFDGSILIRACFYHVRDGVCEKYGTCYYLGTLREDGTIGEFEEVEIVS